MTETLPDTTYVPQEWRPGRKGQTPVSVERLLHIEAGIYDAHALLRELRDHMLAGGGAAGEPGPPGEPGPAGPGGYVPRYEPGAWYAGFPGAQPALLVCEDRALYGFPVLLPACTLTDVAVMVVSPAAGAGRLQVGLLALDGRSLLTAPPSWPTPGTALDLDVTAGSGVAAAAVPEPAEVPAGNYLWTVRAAGFDTPPSLAAVGGTQPYVLGATDPGAALGARPKAGVVALDAPDLPTSGPYAPGAFAGVDTVPAVAWRVG